MVSMYEYSGVGINAMIITLRRIKQYENSKRLQTRQIWHLAQKYQERDDMKTYKLAFYKSKYFRITVE